MPTHSIPRDRLPESSLALLREGYRFIPRRVRRFGTDIFFARLMLRKAICISGADAAEMFYQPGRFTRVGAMPPHTLRLLQDVGSVQTLDADAHRHRKAMFMSIMTRESIASLLRVTEEIWREQMVEWSRQGRIVFIDEAEHLLTQAALRWAGIPVSKSVVSRRAEELSAMIAGSGSVGPEMWHALLLRQRCEFWARSVIRRARSGRIKPQENSPLAIIAHHRDPDGELLSTRIAAVELINILRPTVAVSRYLVFIAHALERFPQSRLFAASRNDDEVEFFVQEVRRYYPFFPFVGGIAREEVTWREHTISRGSWVVLDIYGTNRDRRTWQRPEEFSPGRFRTWDRNPWSLIPQGGGNFFMDHRCAGEWITIALMKQAAGMLTRDMTYQVPKQDLSISLSRMPALPASGFIMSDIQVATSVER